MPAVSVTARPSRSSVISSPSNTHVLAHSGAGEWQLVSAQGMPIAE